jgi:hypothetical protein
VASGVAPSATWPSGQRGAGCELRDTAGRSGSSTNSRSRLPSRLTDSPQIWRLPSRATGPLTTILSPGCSVSLFQPLSVSSAGLSTSTAQFAMSAPSPTFMNMCAWGLRQSSLVTTPSSASVCV